MSNHEELIANMELVMGYSYWADNPDLFNAWEKIPPAMRELQAEVERLREALTDMLSGWRYIRQNHGDLYGVGWDRAQHKAEAALKALDALRSKLSPVTSPQDHSAVAEIDALKAETARLRNFAWTATEHAALHFGEDHSITISGRALLTGKEAK